MKQKAGKVVIGADTSTWPHELRTAKAIASTGRTVIFIRRSEREHERTADVLIDGEIWEMKSPISGNLQKVRKTLRKALAQSANIIYDSQRIKGVPDSNIERELRKQGEAIRSIKRILFVNKARQVIDIK